MKKFEQLKSLHNSISAYYRKDDFSDEHISAVTADFDRLFELTWKTLKEYMNKELGIQAAKTGSPMEIIKLAYRENLIDNAELWIKILKDRNDDTHHYSINAACEYKHRIGEIYLEVIKQEIIKLSALIETETAMNVRPPESLIQIGVTKPEGITAFADELCKRFGITKNELYTEWDSKYKKLYLEEEYY